MAPLRQVQREWLTLAFRVNYGEAPDGFLSVNKKKKATFQVTTGQGNA